MPRFTVDALTQLAARALQRAGASDSMALATARALVAAESEGLPTHGLARVALYAKHVREGRDHVDEQTERDQDPEDGKDGDEEVRRPPVDQGRKAPAPRRETREPAPLQIAQRIGRGERIHRLPGRRERATATGLCRLPLCPETFAPDAGL